MKLNIITPTSSDRLVGTTHRFQQQQQHQGCTATAQPCRRPARGKTPENSPASMQHPSYLLRAASGRLARCTACSSNCATTPPVGTQQNYGELACCDAASIISDEQQAAMAVVAPCGLQHNVCCMARGGGLRRLQLATTMDVAMMVVRRRWSAPSLQLCSTGGDATTRVAAAGVVAAVPLQRGGRRCMQQTAAVTGAAAGR